MAVSYKKLWHILIKQGRKKKALEALAGSNHYTMNRMSREEVINIDIIGKICIALNRKVEDIIDFFQIKKHKPIS